MCTLRTSISNFAIDSIFLQHVSPVAPGMIRASNLVVALSEDPKEMVFSLDYLSGVMQI